MRNLFKLAAAGCLVLLPILGQSAQAPTSSASAPSAEIQQILDLLKQEQTEIQRLEQTVEQQQRTIDRLESGSAKGAEAPRTATAAALNAPARGVVSGALTAAPQPQERAAAAPAVNAETAPLQVKVGDATITPVGFLDLTNTYRSTNAGTSLQSNFAGIPYNNTVRGRLSEDKLTAANSRLGFRVDAKVRGWNVLGYYEGDFLGGIGNAAFNTQVTSNSLLYRIRLFWVDVRKNKFEFLGGQSWSMMVPNRRQISALPGDLFYGQAVDANYLNGLPWGRVPGMRVLYHPSEKLTLGLSLENATQYFGGSGGAGVPVLPSNLAPLIGAELDQSAGNGIATPNLRPDIIAKIAYEPNARVHLELAGVSSSVRLFNPVSQQYFHKTGYGGSFNTNVEVWRNLRLVSNNFWSNGEGRYLFGIAPDFIVRANGSPSLIHSGSTLSGLEYRRGDTQFYAYYGGVYIGRNAAEDAGGPEIGYGFDGSPNSHNRTTQESTAGLTRTFWQDGRYGALQGMLQYAYLTRNPWFVAPGTPKGAHEHVVYFNLRFTLPGGAPAAR